MKNIICVLLSSFSHLSMCSYSFFYFCCLSIVYTSCGRRYIIWTFYYGKSYVLVLLIFRIRRTCRENTTGRGGLPTLCSPKNKTFGDWGRQFPLGTTSKGGLILTPKFCFLFCFVFPSSFYFFLWFFFPFVVNMRSVIMDTSEKFGKKG